MSSARNTSSQTRFENLNGSGKSSSLETKGSLADERRVQFLSATFRHVLLVVCLIFVFALVQMLTLWQVCNTGMKTADSLEHEGLPTLNDLASLQEHLAIYRLDSYEYLFAKEEEKAGKAKAVEMTATQTRTELAKIKQLLPAGDGRRFAANLEQAIDDLDKEFRKVRGLVDTDFPAAMKAMDQDIPPLTERVATAAKEFKDYGYQFSGGQANATFGSFGWIKKNAVMFGAGNMMVAFGVVIFVMLAARRSRAQLLETLGRLDERTQEVAKTHVQLLQASRQAGMAEIATNVLHNIGNVLNSVNVSASLVIDSVKNSKTANVAKVVALLRENAGDLGTFMASDPRGRRLPDYMAKLADHLLAVQAATIRELDSLRDNIEHIKGIVAMQQNYARVSGLKEVINLNELVEDSLRMNEDALTRHGVAVIREFENVPPMAVEKHKILQILVNLIRNAKRACQDAQTGGGRMTVRVATAAGRVKISVTDNGIGIPPENLARLFNHGFTTRKDGHGFGLHSGALAAREMGGSLNVQSDGVGRGATFTLELPAPPDGLRE